MLPGCLPAPRSVVIDLSLALLALLGGDDDDAVGGTCTVDGTRGSVLQDFDALDVVGVHDVQATLERNTVDDVERVGSIVGTGTTDTNARRLTRLARVGGDVDTGCQTLQGIVDTNRSLALKVFAADLGDGCGNDALLLHTVTDNDNVLEEFLVLNQDDVHLHTSGKLLWNVTHETESDSSADGDTSEGEITIDIGNSSDSCTLDIGISTDDGLAHLIYNDAIHHHSLGKEPQW